MKIKTQDHNDIAIIELQGELDSEAVEDLKNIITSTIRTQKNGIVLDMQNIEFIDGAGLEQLLWARDYCDDNHCQLRLASLKEDCAKILELTRLQGEFDCYAEPAGAVKSFA
ncbi:MAG: STAS domain-containing protein [Phycisphaerae bacterium]|jgi:anti-anti-sigma factor